jgi:putative (di)nucleoside polyphosphate hydrolase
VDARHGAGHDEVDMPKYEDLPYRPCAGLCVINRKGLVFVGRRTDGPEHTDETHVWQMPQGGIDDGEKSYQAALRELYEETSIKSVEKLGEIKGWLVYDIPKKFAKKAWDGKYRGQTQKWYALRFTGKDREIDIDNPGGGHEPEFVDWRWVPMADLPDLVVPFKRKTYERVVKAFSRFAKLPMRPERAKGTSKRRSQVKRKKR